ncbi:MAG: hopanoid biosynthesis-associated RND transporter HpnN, partial [Bradyrhizobiaceae bacterium]|nr:hopanoid biosynthesis-associated RND transporter HpnN [Bradyrhizobiaceae bacterium]
MLIKVLTNLGRTRFRYGVKFLHARLLRPVGTAPLTSAIATVVGFCIRRPWQVVGLAIAIAAGATMYAAESFAIKTDITALISPDLPWAKRAIAYMREFPRFGIIVVVDGPTAEAAEQAQAELARALGTRTEQFRTVSQPGGGPFFERNGLLFLPSEKVARFTEGARRADALIATVAEDPSLRGILTAMSMVFIGVKRGLIDFDDMAYPLTMAGDTVEDALAGRPASFSWQALTSEEPPTPSSRRRFLLVEPVLDFSALQPGHAATELVASLASDLKFGDRGIRVRQTGQVPIDDDQFGTLRQSAFLNIAVSVLGVLAILWLALRSFRIIAAVATSLAIGLAVSTAAGLLLTGALNVISVAFFVLFIGL